MIPGPLERDGLPMAAKNHGTDIITAVDVEAVIYQRAQGADLYIVGCWRYTPLLKWYGAKHITTISDLRGGRIGIEGKNGGECERCGCETQHPVLPHSPAVPCCRLFLGVRS